MKRVATTAAGIVAALLVWQVLAAVVGSTVFPSPLDVLDELRTNGVGVIWSPTSTTLVEASAGFAIGNVIAVAIGVVCVRFRRVEAVGMQFALLTYTVPVIALGAIMTTLWPASVVRITISALYVVCTTVMGTVLGLRSADDRSLELMAAYGAPTRRQFAFVRFPAAVPSLIAAFRIAAPASVLGAIIGEYLGGEGGLGVAMVASQRSGAVPRTWALAIAGALLAGSGYWALGALGRRWAARTPTISIPRRAPRQPVAFHWSRPVRRAAGVVAGIGAVALAWYAALALFGVNEFVARTPADVWDFLTGAEEAAANRSEIVDALLVTLGHAGVGFLVGTGFGVACAVVFNLVPRLERIVLPVAIALQAVPVVAFLPLGLLLLGRGVALAALVAGLVSFFPALVNVDSALRETPRAATDLLTANGAPRGRQLMLARLPYAAPAVFSAARIAIPASVAGALLVEWMVLGDGMGELMLGAANQFRYDMMWSAVVVVSVVTIVLASAARSFERMTTTRLGLPSAVA